MFRSFLGNEPLKAQLSALLAQKKLPHAVCICGEVGCGSGFFATLLAAAYLEDRAGLVQRGAHPDLVEIAGSGASGQIAVEDVRTALYEMNKAAVMADGRRVLFVRGAGALNASSANALLKMMEEPPAGVLFLLTAQHEQQLLPTLRSRLSLFRVQELEESLCAEEAQRRIPACTPQNAAGLARLFGGRLGLVLRALSDAGFYALADAAKKFCDAALSGDRYTAMVQLSAAANREELAELLFVAAVCLGAKLRQSPGEAARIGALFRAVEQTREQVQQNANIKLAATLLVVQAARET